MQYDHSQETFFLLTRNKNNSCHKSAQQETTSTAVNKEKKILQAI
jgi:hypothetical protein